MDLLSCSQCGSRFYAPGIRPSDSRCCPQCGGDLGLALDRITSIPLDARWLDSRVAPGGARTLTAMAEGDRIPSKGLA
jgi:hypothetical protein